jgi:hypothetical protein
LRPLAVPWKPQGTCLSNIRVLVQTVVRKTRCCISPHQRTSGVTISMCLTAIVYSSQQTQHDHWAPGLARGPGHPCALLLCSYTAYLIRLQDTPCLRGGAVQSRPIQPPRIQDSAPRQRIYLWYDHQHLVQGFTTRNLGLPTACTGCDANNTYFPEVGQWRQKIHAVVAHPQAYLWCNHQHVPCIDLWPLM